MGSFKLSKKAATDLDGIYLYGLEVHGFERAFRFKNSLESRFQALADHPLQSPATGFRDGYRYSVHAPYTIYFRMLENETVQIVRILRGQDPRTEI